MVIFQTMGGTFSIVPGEGSQGEEAISLAEALAVPLQWDPPPSCPLSSQYLFCA